MAVEVTEATGDRQRPAIALPRGLRVARLVAGYGAIACALPYLVLKIVWLGGGTLGVADREMMRDAGMMALNAVTAGMDLVGIGIALAFTHRWGLRIPAWLLLPPMWVASGLLARFVVWVPITGAVKALAADPLPRVTRGPVLPWVYVLVYIGFVGLGIGLMLAFALYARTRWADTIRSTTGASPPGATHSVQVPLANAAALLAIAAAALHLAWAFGVPVGLSQEAAARRTFLGASLNAIDAAMMVAGAIGLLMIVHRMGRNTPFWLPLAMAWVGSGALFGWGLWPLANVLAQTALLRGTARTALMNLNDLLCVLVGLTMGLVTLFALAERRALERP